MAKKKQNLTPEELLEQALVPEQEWPYSVPENWVWVRLGSLVEIIGGGTPSKSNPDYWSGDISWASVKDVKGDYLFETIDKISELGLANSSANLADINDLILVTRIEPGKTIIPQIRVAVNQDLKVIKSKLPIKFLHYYFKNFINEFVKQSSGSTVLGITLDKVQSTVFPLPPLCEQQRIVNQIESLFEKLDQARGLIQDSLDSFENRKAAILHKAFSGELTKKWRDENGVGMESWIDYSLQDVAEYKKGPFGSSITKSMFVPKGENTYKVYEQGNAIRKTLNYGEYYINSQKFQELKSFEIKPGDIIVSCAGTIGETYKLPIDCERGVINQALMRVRVNPIINEKFFLYYFGEVLTADIRDKSKGTAIKNIPPFAIMKKMHIKLPSISEQNEIVIILEGLLEREEKSKEMLDVIEKINMLKKSILTSAFRGELVTNDPSEENAHNLLIRELRK